MPKKHYTPEQIVTKLKLIEVLMSQGKQILLAYKEAGISDKSYCCWRKHYNTKRPHCSLGYKPPALEVHLTKNWQTERLNFM